MSIEIDRAFVEQYSANVLTLAQQKESRFEAAVDVDRDIVGASKTVERIGAGEAYDITSRHGDTVYVDTPHSRRWLDLADKGYADLVDESDKIRMLIDPTSPYVRAGVMALNRKKDDVIITALTGTARAATTSGGNIVLPAAQKIVHGGVGMTMAKLRSAKQLFDEAEVDEDEERFAGVTAEQLNDMLALTEVTSSDYNVVKALVRGEVDTFMGFKFIRSERLIKSGTTRSCPFWAKSGMRLGVGKDIVTSIDKLPTKNMSVQIYVRMALGAVRTEEVRVVEVQCTEVA